jgi:uncharacterized protein with HEPN domain
MSKTDPLRIADYLGHIAEAIRRIECYTANLRETDFLDAELIQDGVIRNIEIIGEASRNIERYHPEFSSFHSDIPWRDIYLMRNQISHGYFSVDLDVIWKTLQHDIPILKKQINALLKNI